MAILLAFPLTYAFSSIASESSGGFLLLLTIAVGVPQAYNEYWSHYDRMWKAVVWVVVACLVMATEFTGLYLVGVEIASFSPAVASAGAFLFTTVGNFAVLSLRGSL